MVHTISNIRSKKQVYKVTVERGCHYALCAIEKSYIRKKTGILKKIPIVMLSLNIGDRLIPSMFDTRLWAISDISKIGCSLHVRIRESVPTKYTLSYNSPIKPSAFHSRVFPAALGRYIARLYDCVGKGSRTLQKNPQRCFIYSINLDINIVVKMIYFPGNFIA